MNEQPGMETANLLISSMSQVFPYLVFFVGAVVCLVGSIGVISALLIWTLDNIKVCRQFARMVIAYHYRKRRRDRAG